MKKTTSILSLMTMIVSMVVLNGCTVADYGDGFADLDNDKPYLPKDSTASVDSTASDNKGFSINTSAKWTPISLSTKEKNLAQNGNEFAIQLLEKAVEIADKKDNILIAPLSLQMALGMLGNGLSEAAFNEMTSVIYDKDVTRSQLNDYFAGLYEPLTHAADGTICRLANSVWVQRDYAIQPAFLQALTNCCNARASYVDYINAPDEAKAYMNEWASEMTDGLIPSLSLDVNNLTRVVLLNATLLRSVWKRPFKVMEEKLPFTSGSKRTHNVTMMETGTSEGAMQHDLFTSVTVYYGNGQFVMDLILPDKKHTVEEVIPHLLDKGKWQDVDAIIHLPMFSYRTCNDFIPLMKKLGILRLFNDTDALSGINESLSIGQLLQDTYINVNENGTEAAAVTEINSFSSADPGAPQREKIVLDFNRPFLYTIRESSTGILLYAGCVNEIE